MQMKIYLTHGKLKKSCKRMKSQVQYSSLRNIEFIMDWMFGWKCIIVWFAMGIVYLTYFLKVDAIPITHQKNISQMLIGAIPITNQNKIGNVLVIGLQWIYHIFDLFFKVNAISTTNFDWGNIRYKLETSWNCISICFVEYLVTSRRKYFLWR